MYRIIVSLHIDCMYNVSMNNILLFEMYSVNAWIIFFSYICICILLFFLVDYICICILLQRQWIILIIYETLDFLESQIQRRSL